jgi:hypothetical protein
VLSGQKVQDSVFIRIQINTVGRNGEDMTAQISFKNMMKEVVAPALRKMGFKGSGQNYWVPSDSCWAAIGFQKSMSSDSSSIRFTINITVIEKEVWSEIFRKSPYYGKKPSPNTSYGIEWQQRVGFLMPQNQDYWWSLREGQDIESLGIIIAETISKYVMPEIDSRMKRIAQQKNGGDA